MLKNNDSLVIIYGKDGKIYMGHAGSSSTFLPQELGPELAKTGIASCAVKEVELERAVEVRRFDQVTQNGGIASMQKAAFIVPFMKVVPKITLPATHAVVVTRAFDAYWYDEMIDMLKALEQDQKNIETALINKHSKISAPNEQDVLNIANKQGLRGVPNAANAFRPDPRKN